MWCKDLGQVIIQSAQNAALTLHFVIERDGLLYYVCGWRELYKR
jgi:hypothetical protein